MWNDRFDVIGYNHAEPVYTRALNVTFQAASNPERGVNEPWFQMPSTYSCNDIRIPSTDYWTNRSEDKIDEISRKLDRICSIVDGKANSPANQSSISGQIPSIYTTTIASSIEPSQVIADEGPESENEGELSLTAHATFAADYAQKAVNTRESTQDLTTSLNALRRAVESSPKPSHAASPQPSAVRGVEISGYQMPPLDIATTVLKILKGPSASGISIV